MIPTSVITGFLGVGKTTAILHLLKQKPANERWAVLVNEFGEVGVDGSLFAGTEANNHGVFIREVPGGCMCCTAGLPMQIALNVLLARARPHRLLIEPTGLGHPREVIGALSVAHYRPIIDLRATITLVDARKVHDKHYTEHDIFRQQLEIADVIVANKADQYQQHDFAALVGYIENTTGLHDKVIFQLTRGSLQLDWLAPPTAAKLPDESPRHDRPGSAPLPETTVTPEQGYLSIDNSGEGFHSRGWIFNPGWVFDARKLHTLLSGIEAERVKGIFITDRGIIAYNKADQVLTQTMLDDTLDSRIECISVDPGSLDVLDAALLACVTHD